MSNLTALAFDLDGTIYNGSQVVAGARKAVAQLRRKGFRIFFFTNNSTKTRAQIVCKLRRLGFSVSGEDVYCTSYALSTYVRAQNIKSAYVIGTKDFRSVFLQQGLRLRQDPNVEAVVVGLDPGFCFTQILSSLDAIQKGAKLIVANIDDSYPGKQKRRMPGCGVIVNAIATASGHRPDFIAGKPHAYMLKLLCREHGFLPSQICVIGDNPHSDIALARRCGCLSILFDPQRSWVQFRGPRALSFPQIVSLLATLQKG